MDNNTSSIEEQLINYMSGFYIDEPEIIIMKLDSGKWRIKYNDGLLVGESLNNQELLLWIIEYKASKQNFKKAKQQLNKLIENTKYGKEEEKEPKKHFETIF